MEENPTEKNTKSEFKMKIEEFDLETMQTIPHNGKKEPIFDIVLMSYDSNDFRCHPSASIYK